MCKIYGVSVRGQQMLGKGDATVNGVIKEGLTEDLKEVREPAV